jgi:hypothetical protein
MPNIHFVQIHKVLLLDLSLSLLSLSTVAQLLYVVLAKRKDRVA